MHFSKEISVLVEQVYCPSGRYNSVFPSDQWLGTSGVRYFSLARHALVSAFQLLNIGIGDRVAVPEFICRDLLASLATVGVSVQYYPVDEKLTFSGSPSEMVGVKAILAVNYFGFPQDLKPFEEISRTTGAIIIEDNAHGFLSCDEEGIPLGRRTPLSIFSLRKTMPIVNGAALVANDPVFAMRLPAHLEEDEAMPLGFRVKETFRRSVPVVGISGCYMMTIATRLARRMITGYAIQPPQSDAETVIPIPREPNRNSLVRITQLDENAEICRRRSLYSLMENEIILLGGAPIFVKLPIGTAPYVFPFRVSDELIFKIRGRLGQIGLECHRWPDLPDAILRMEKSHYSNVWMVPFLW